MKDDLEKAKKVSEFLKDKEMPATVKSQIVLGTALGVQSDTIIKGAVASLSAIETRKAEAENPEPEQPLDYSEIERTIAEMLQENTGAHLLDSGGAYGRHWESNRKITDFRELPELKVTTWKDGETEISINIFHYLTTFLEIDTYARKLQKAFYKYADQPENESISWLALAEEFGEKIAHNHGFSYGGTFNSYNSENLLSQVIQAVWLYRNEDEYDAYLILQIHNGCDVRGGYTKPKIFRVLERDYFIMAQSDLDASCGCGHIYSDDSGYHWYDDEDAFKDRDEYAMPKQWKPKPKHKKPKDWEYELRCSKCKQPVKFWPRLEW